MGDQLYPPIPGTIKVPYEVLPPIASDDGSALPSALTNPPPPTPGSKSIFAFWHSGIKIMPPYLLRNVLAWYRRYAPLGWTVYVIDNAPDSPLNLSNFIDVTDPTVVPAALIAGEIGGSYVGQVMSDFSRFPLLLKYGGIYLDAGVLQFGDINGIWERHIANPDSPYRYAGLTMGDAGPEDPESVTIINFHMMTLPDNPLLLRAHRILMKLWEGKTSTAGMARSPLVAHVPLLRVPDSVAVTEAGAGEMKIDDEAMTDYAIQIQCLGAAQRWKDEADGWDGPAYVREHCWLYSMVDMAYANEQVTSWNSKTQHDLFSTKLPEGDGTESETQKLAREMVEACIGRSWCIKLAHGFSAKLFGAPTLGMLWRDNKGSDCAPGTYGAWLRWSEVNLTHVDPPKPLNISAYEASRVASMKSMLE